MADESVDQTNAIVARIVRYVVHWQRGELNWTQTLVSINAPDQLVLSLSRLGIKKDTKEEDVKTLVAMCVKWWQNA